MFDKLIPQSLKTLDVWLLKNQPLIWRTRIHWVLFGSLVFHLLVLIAYCLVPFSMSNLPSRVGIDYFRFALIPLSCFFLIGWGVSSVKIPVKSNTRFGYLLTVFLYWLGVTAICVNVWVTAKALENKISNLVDDHVLMKHQTLINKNYSDKTFAPSISYSTIQELGRVYELPGNFLEHQTEVSLVTISKFWKTFGITYEDFHSILNKKVKIIQTSKLNDDLMYIGYEFHYLYWLSLLAMLILPMIALLCSLTNILHLVFQTFLYFVTILGVELIQVTYAIKFELIYIFLMLIVCLCTLAFKKNLKQLNWFRIYALAMIPMAFFIIVDSPELSLSNFHGSLLSVLELLLTFISAIFVGNTGYLYYKKINQPESV